MRGAQRPNERPGIGGLRTPAPTALVALAAAETVWRGDPERTAGAPASDVEVM
jgi:hypothetical protein